MTDTADSWCLRYIYIPGWDQLSGQDGNCFTEYGASISKKWRLLWSIGISRLFFSRIFATVSHHSLFGENKKATEVKLVHKTNSFAVLALMGSFVFRSEAKGSCARLLSARVGQRPEIPPYNSLTEWMTNKLSWAAYSYKIDQQVSCFGTPKFITVFIQNFS